MTIIEICGERELTRLRRIALSAQSLLRAEPHGRGIAAARKTIQHLGYVQIDSVSVVERAHHHVLRTRVPNYKPSMMNQMLQGGDIFEYWAHAAAFLPIADFRFSLPYKHAIKSGQTHWFKLPDKKLMRELLTRVESDGPIRSRDLEHARTKRGGWWDWKPAKKALEQLYMQGDLMVSDRKGFQKSYDLTDRVLPSQTNTKMPSLEEFAQHILDQQLRCHGLVSLKGLTYLRRNTELRKTVNHLLCERWNDGHLEKLLLPGGEVFFLRTGMLDAPRPRAGKRMLILSPFDNCVIQRERLKLLFDFDYQIECYVPAAKRRYGYFSLPLLFGDRFVGRMDCKAHRKISQLEIISLHFEGKDYDYDVLISAFVEAIKKFQHFQQCDSVVLTKVHPKYLALPLRRALND